MYDYCKDYNEINSSQFPGTTESYRGTLQVLNVFLSCFLTGERNFEIAR